MQINRGNLSIIQMTNFELCYNGDVGITKLANYKKYKFIY